MKSLTFISTDKLSKREFTLVTCGAMYMFVKNKLKIFSWKFEILLKAYPRLEL